MCTWTARLIPVFHHNHNNHFNLNHIHMILGSLAPRLQTLSSVTLTDLWRGLAARATGQADPGQATSE